MPADGLPLFADGLRAARITDAVLSSAGEGRWVDVPAPESLAVTRMTAQAPLLEVRGIGKQYPGVRALDGVDFDVTAGEVHCLLGPNGAGKSTLIKCVSGVVAPTEGEILVDGEPLPTGEPSESLARGVATIYQELDLVEDLTVAQSVFLGHEPRRRSGLLNRELMRKETTALLERLDHGDIPPDAHVRKLRPAAQQVVSIARALSHDVRLLIMDEPSAILDDQEIEVLFGVVRRLAADGVGVIYISHRLDEIRRIGNRVTVLVDGRTVATGLPADTPPGELVLRMVGRRVEQLFPERVAPGDDVVLSVRNVSRAPDVHESSFDVHAGEVLGIGGLIGAGRSELLRLIYGLDRPDGGEVWVDGKRLPSGADVGGDRCGHGAGAGGPQVAGPAARLERDQERQPRRPRPVRHAVRCSTAAPSARPPRSSCGRSTPSPTIPTGSRASSRAATSRSSCSRAG